MLQAREASWRSRRGPVGDGEKGSDKSQETVPLLEIMMSSEAPSRAMTMILAKPRKHPFEWTQTADA